MTVMSSTANDNSDSNESQEAGRKEFPSVPEAAIVKPDEERPVKMQIRPEENLEEREADTEHSDSVTEDMDGDDSPDWDPAVGPGV
jgi:hypothetical protein